jgi:succinate dehydrogenase/fumarate reductase cytochrome b subunit
MERRFINNYNNSRGCESPYFFVHIMMTESNTNSKNSFIHSFSFVITCQIFLFGTVLRIPKFDSGQLHAPVTLSSG